MDFFEQSINNYNGLSSETKPTIAAGNNVPNGSRWREVDTGAVYFFNFADDTWYLSSPSSGSPVTEGTVKKQLVQDNNGEAILTAVLKELKKMNLHLALITDNYITDTEVE